MDGNLFCMSAADSCRGPFGSPGLDASFIGQTWQGCVIHSQQVNLPVIWPEAAEWWRLNARPHVLCRPRACTAHRNGPVSSFVAPITATGSHSVWLLVCRAKELQQGCGMITSVELGAKKSEIFVGLVSVGRASVCV